MVPTELPELEGLAGEYELACVGMEQADSDEPLSA